MEGLKRLLLKIENNNGLVTELDCIKLTNFYTTVYGEKYTKLDREYEILYYYKKLQELCMKK